VCLLRTMLRSPSDVVLPPCSRAGPLIGDCETEPDFLDLGGSGGSGIIGMHFEFSGIASRVACLRLIDVNADEVGAGVSSDFADPIMLGLPGDNGPFFISPDCRILISLRVPECHIDHLHGGRGDDSPEVLAAERGQDDRYTDDQERCPG
jgi:hypothetical protein